ncbi:hypothetical protein BJX61DRAFT_507220 [Aspergillus egyptiacus]|nr:hypothetical protein BJX61DRAFT_507220 [Aspergillus egyptiacus]
MPMPASSHSPANRGGSAKTSPIKSKPLDIGLPLGLYDTNSVRAKVRKWQQQGGGVITADDIYCEEEDTENVSTAGSKTKSVKGKDASTSTPIRKRSRSTPRKRLVSDEHWKLNRTPTQAPGAKLPTPRRIAEYTTNEPIRPPRSVKKEDKKDEKTPPPPLLSPRMRREDDKGSATPPLATTSRARRKSHTSGDIDAIIEKLEREHAKDKSSKSSSRPGTAEKNRYSTLSEPAEKNRYSTLSEPSDIVKKKESAQDDESEWAASEADFSELSRRRSRGVNHASKGRMPVKSPKGGILGQIADESRKMFSKPELKPELKPEPSKQPVQSKGSKIEAWLSNTPDPFVVDKVPDVEIPAPLKTRRRKSKYLGEEKETKSELSVDSDFSRRTSKRRVKSGETTSSSERPKSRDDKAKSRESLRETSPSSRRRTSERKRPFPSTGPHRLSTIMSVESTSAQDDGRSAATAATAEKRKGSQTTYASEERDQVDPNALSVVSARMQKLTTHDDSEERDQVDPNALSVVSARMQKLTTHDDLISVLSSTTTRSRSLRSARSLRSRNRNPTVADILKELALDEVKYMRELRTLVGGVIPVLLTCVLSRSDSAVAAGLFSPSADPSDELTFTKPIVNMGVAIERLKLLHKRIPLEAADALLHWAHGAQKVYREYLRAWRLGFKDVVVNLAPLEEGEENNDNDNAETQSLDDGMSRDENGDVVDGDGQKVDVAYLLKRPLVRLKYLAKTFKGINMLEPSAKAEEVAMAYQDLVEEARRRAREERARLEDESAAAIDPARARDPETLEALTGVTIDKARRVRARDFFNLSLYHSSGQVIDCRAELLFRDNAQERGPGGDLLICEVDHADRWLLFPPIDIACVSARNGDEKGEIVVMLRSPPAHERRFQELLSLRMDEEDVVAEWIQMLGRTPVPPAICRSQSFIERARQRQRAQTTSSPDDVSLSQKTPPSPTSVAIPIGEKPTSRLSRRSWAPKEPGSTNPSTAEPSTATESRSTLETDITRESDYGDEAAEVSSPPQSILHSRDPRKIGIVDDNNNKPAQGLKRSGAKRISKYGELSPQAPQVPSPVSNKTDAVPPSPPADRDETKPRASKTPKTRARAESEGSTRVSSVPSAELPSIPKLRQGSSISYIPDPEPEEEEFDLLDYNSVPEESPTKQKTHSRSGSSESDGAGDDEPPAPPPHSRSPSSTGSNLANAPVLSPTGGLLRRRGSSPLKHEYEPSTESDSHSDSDTSTVRRYDIYSDSDTVTDSSDEEDSEDELPRSRGRDITPMDQQESDLSAATSSLSLSVSTNQAGYRSVPYQPGKSSSAIATVFAWSDKGSWEIVLPDECKIIVSPGLVEAFDMKDDPLADAGDAPFYKPRPIIALELTPLVPIRRGTAIDISIRSPPTPRSQVTWSNNIMFRSRNADECEVLYGLINQARTNNPTYIALQNARGPMLDFPAPLERANKSSGLFGWPRRRKSYRASASSPRSLADNSESSVGTMNSAFSALKRFGAGSKMFSISRSSVTSRSRKDGEGGSLYSSSAGSGAGIGRMAAAIKGVDGIGLSNAKIRLYARETQSKWRDMGAARLTIMPAPSPSAPSPEPRRPDPAADGNHPDDTSPPGSGAASPQRAVEPVSQKRIVIRGKTRGEVLLDVCLDESCFERVARTGIAVSVREEHEDGNAVPQKGGVMTGSSRVYMIQMKGEAEAAYTFGLVGKLKY